MAVTVREQTRSRVANALERMHLLGPVERLREAWLIRQADDGADLPADGLPLPPARLRLLVDGRSGDATRFLVLGRPMFESIRDAVIAAGREPSELGAVLDFGCGCGRVLRHWHGVEGPEIHGSDYNPDLIDWVREGLPFVHPNVNGLAPPTAYEDEKFDLIYALSVFTHLDRELQDAWIVEFRRILRPGGLLIVSVLGESMAGRLTGEERERFDRGEAGRRTAADVRPQPLQRLPPTLLRHRDPARRVRRRPAGQSRHARNVDLADRLHRSPIVRVARLGGNVQHLGCLVLSISRL